MAGAPTSFRLSPVTRAQLRDLAAEYNGNQTTALAVAIDRMWRENMDTHTTARVTAAQMIRRYREPQWLVEPIGEPADREDVAAINQQGYEVLDRNIRGWGIYNAIVRVPLACAGDVDYLARLATAPRRNCGHCHTCGTPLRTVLDGEEWCPTCQQYRRYAAHGWAGTTDPDCPSPVTPANEPHETTPTNLLTIAEAIYSAVFGDLDDECFGSAKVQEIYDWLNAGDPSNDLNSLIAEWREYDAEDVAKI